MEKKNNRYSLPLNSPRYLVSKGVAGAREPTRAQPFIQDLIIPAIQTLLLKRVATNWMHSTPSFRGRYSANGFTNRFQNVLE